MPIVTQIRNSGVKIISVGLNQTTEIFSDISDRLFLSSTYNISANISNEIIELICPIPPPPEEPMGTLCSQNSQNAWLDVAVIIDISNAMSTRYLSEAAGQLDTLFRLFTIGQQPKHSTRVGIITFGSDATVRESLINTTNFDNLQTAFFDITNFYDPNDKGGNILK
uniref:VWFA domain-containing protein n=1 Tax=Panagrolaimus superbus TaxID=310955 RepID=A0A914YSM2_9BILA